MSVKENSLFRVRAMPIQEALPFLGNSFICSEVASKPNTIWLHYTFSIALRKNLNGLESWRVAVDSSCRKRLTMVYCHYHTNIQYRKAWICLEEQWPFHTMNMPNSTILHAKYYLYFHFYHYPFFLQRFEGVTATAFQF